MVPVQLLVKMWGPINLVVTNHNSALAFEHIR